MGAMSRNLFSCLYFLLLLVHLALNFYQVELWPAITKGLLMPVLASMAIVHLMCQRPPYFFWLLSALFFSWMGDLILLADDCFIFGLGAFLLAHVVYINMNRMARTDDEMALLPTQELRYLFILVLAGCAVLYVLFPYLEELKIPVIFYTAAITYMGISALYRYGRTINSSFYLVFMGAILFMISDTLLALNLFIGPMPNSSFWVMLTYGTAQYMLTFGFIKHAKADAITI